MKREASWTGSIGMHRFLNVEYVRRIQVEAVCGPIVFGQLKKYVIREN